jgi:hypothetical protein
MQVTVVVSEFNQIAKQGMKIQKAWNTRVHSNKT